MQKGRFARPGHLDKTGHHLRRRDRQQQRRHLQGFVALKKAEAEEEAQAAAAEVLNIDPKFSLDYFAESRPHIDPANTARLIETLRKAGLK